MDQRNRTYDWRTLIDEAVAQHSGENRSVKQDRSRQRIAEILKAAVRVFARDGVTRARIGDIAADAGVPPASIYDYFKSKEELAYAVPIQQQTEFYAEFGHQSIELSTSRERLIHFLWLSADFARRNPEWARVLYLEVWPSVLIKEARVRHILDDFGRVVVGLIREGSARGEWPEQPLPYQTATILIGSINQLIITWLLYRKPRDLVGAARALIDRLMTILEIVDVTSAKKVRPHRILTRKPRQPLAKPRLNR